MQHFFRAWAELDLSSEHKSEIFIDYTKMQFLRSLSQNLLQDMDDTELIEQLSRNITLAKKLANEIIFEALSVVPELNEKAPKIQCGRSGYLGGMFELFRVGGRV